MSTLASLSAATSTYAALARHNLAAGLTPRVSALFSALLMLANNVLFFVIWVIYFRNFSSLRGWDLADFSLLMGAGTWGFGVMVVAVGGVRDIARVVADGSLDVHLGRPSHPLPSLLLSRSTASGWGDAASAFIFWCWFGDLTLADLPFALLVSTAGGLVLAALVTLFQCLAFWLPRTSAMGDMFLDMVITITIYPQNIYGFFVRLVLFTALPAAFVTYVPVQAIREGSWVKAVMVIAAAAFYSALAAWVFERGLRQYTSGNRLLENR